MLYNSPSIEVLFFIPCFVLTIDLLAQHVNAQSGMVHGHVTYIFRKAWNFLIKFPIETF